MTKIVTHDSSFHTDDIFAVAVLLLIAPDAQVVRSRDRKEIDSADYVVDVGMVNDPAKHRFDHHMPEGAGARENGIPYASFGLVWKQFGIELSGGKRAADLVDRRLAQPIDAHDNGMTIGEYKFKDVREYTIGEFLNSFVTSHKQVQLNSIFMQMVSIAKDLLLREITAAKKDVENEDKLLATYNSSSDKRIIVMLEEFPNWREVLAKTPEALFGIYQAADGHWKVAGIPDLAKPYHGPVRKYLPEAWRGKEKEELQQISGVSDAVFVHRTGFKGGAKTKEGAIKLAKIALNA